MKLMRLAAAISAVGLLGAASPLGSPCAQAQYDPDDYTCHENCQIRCHMLYPNDQGKQRLCTWSCIDQYCGGGEFP